MSIEKKNTLCFGEELSEILVFLGQEFAYFFDGVVKEIRVHGWSIVE